MSLPLSGKTLSVQACRGLLSQLAPLRLGVYGLAGALLLAIGLTANAAGQSTVREEHLRVLQGSALEKDYADMLFNYLVREARQAGEKRCAHMASVQSEADFSSWQNANRQKFLELIGGLPSERTPLNARVVGEIVRQGYVVRKVIFESLPELYVTANLYVPTEGKPPFPAVLGPLGHSTNGKAYAVYQHLFIGLAKRGYVVLTWDPQGQGERLQYWDFLSGRRRFEFNQHAMAGIQEYLLGQNLARYFIWDGMRALDYLTSLPEVDATRIGVTGSSGGGTLTTYISMLDPRVKAASIVTFITSVPEKIENRINDAESDPEQDVQGLLAAGIDHPEFVGMIAPRPVMIGAAARDFFPIEGTRQTFKELAALYKKLGVPERLKMVEFDHRHMYSQPLREATTAWFERWLKGTESEVHEPPITPEVDVTLECTTTGQVVTSLGGKRMADFNRAAAERLLANLERQRHEPAFGSTLLARVRDHLGLPSAAVEPQVRKLTEVDAGGLAIEKLVVESEPGIVVPVRIVYSKSSAQPMPAVVYLRDRGGDQDYPGIFESLAGQGRLVAVADVRGFGETRSPRNVPDEGVEYFDPRGGMDADFAYAGFFLGRPLLGMRVWDALHVAEYLRSRSDVDPKRIGIVGRGWAGATALFTAAVDSRLAWAAVEGAPASYGEIARSEEYAQPVSLMLPGVLHDFDLPDVLAGLAPRALLVLNPTDALVGKMSWEKARAALEPVRRVYESAGAAQGFDVRVVPIESDVGGALESWIVKR
jgi:cephalosporin-C deacetylase-like acetyl esterase